MSSFLDPNQKPPAPAPPLTPDDLLALPNRKDYELVEGTLVERSANPLAQPIAARLIAALRAFCDTKDGLAWVLDDERGYLSASAANTVRKPSVSVVRRDRLPSGALPEGWLPFAPDIAAEIVSPHDVVDEFERKVEGHIKDGARLVLIIHPEARIVRAQRPDGTAFLLLKGSTLVCGDILPGFSYPIDDLFPPTPPTLEPIS